MIVNFYFYWVVPMCQPPPQCRRKRRKPSLCPGSTFRIAEEGERWWIDRLWIKQPLPVYFSAPASGQSSQTKGMFGHKMQNIGHGHLIVFPKGKPITCSKSMGFGIGQIWIHVGKGNSKSVTLEKWLFWKKCIMFWITGRFHDHIKEKDWDLQINRKVTSSLLWRKRETGIVSPPVTETPLHLSHAF